MSNELFQKIVGQEMAKRTLAFFLNGHANTGVSPHLLFVAPKGQGKTTLAKEYARHLYVYNEDRTPVLVPSVKDPTVLKPKSKTYIEINCSTLKNLKMFVNAILIPYVVDKDVTILFDEASELPKDVTMALLTILNPNPTNKTSWSYEEYTCDFDFTKQTFLFATNESHKVFPALVDRLERVTLQDYTMSQLAQIMKMGLPADLDCPDALLEQIALTVRGNARQAQKMATKILSYLGSRVKFAADDWVALQKHLSIRPLGLNELEIRVLSILERHPDGVSLTHLSASTGMSRESLQKDVEMHLQKHNLMSVETTGRVLTAAGLQYLRSLPAV